MSAVCCTWETKYKRMDHEEQDTGLREELYQSGSIESVQAALGSLYTGMFPYLLQPPGKEPIGSV